MCYSAQVWADDELYVRQFGADIDIRTFFDLYVRKRGGEKVKTPKAMDVSFLRKAEFAALVREIHSAEIAALEQDLFKQAKRMADAERSLLAKETKKARNDQRIAGNKVEQIKGRLANLKRAADRQADHRIFPGMYAPVMVVENDRRLVKPMRYQCRPKGKPAFYDTKFPGTYNARRDNLEGFWKGLFGASHGVMADPTEKAPDLLSFAAITDEPEPEVAAAGHDRTIINLKPEHLDAWLSPSADLAKLYALFDDRQRPFYEHRRAA